MGRPSEFTQEKGDAICARLAEGESLRTICADEGMPSVGTALRWVATFEDFQKQYVRAREAGMDAMAEETLEIADDARNDWMERNGKDDAGWVQNGEHVQRSRLRVDARKWYLSKLAPKKYGDKLALAGDESNPLTVVVRKLTDA